MTQNFKLEVQKHIVEKITSETVVQECEELNKKYPELYEKFRISLLAVRLLSQRVLRSQAQNWDLKT